MGSETSYAIRIVALGPTFAIVTDAKSRTSQTCLYAASAVRCLHGSALEAQARDKGSNRSPNGKGFVRKRRCLGLDEEGAVKRSLVEKLAKEE